MYPEFIYKGAKRERHVKNENLGKYVTYYFNIGSKSECFNLGLYGTLYLEFKALRRVLNSGSSTRWRGTSEAKMNLASNLSMFS